jgi:hypothetical protein
MALARLNAAAHEFDTESEILDNKEIVVFILLFLRILGSRELLSSLFDHRS